MKWSRPSRHEVSHSQQDQRDVNEKLLADNAEMKGHIRQLEAMLEAKPSGEDD